jgi:hypothetical protein
MVGSGLTCKHYSRLEGNIDNILGCRRRALPSPVNYGRKQLQTYGPGAHVIKHFMTRFTTIGYKIPGLANFAKTIIYDCNRFTTLTPWGQCYKTFYGRKL